MLNVGIVGLGYMAAMHIKAWRQVEGAQILAVCNPSKRNLDGDLSSVFDTVGSNEKLKLDMSNIRAYSDYASLLADPDIHIIDICSPTWAHHDQSTSALASGVHVLLEKPVARTAKEARRIVEAAGHASHFLMPAMCLRFWPDWRQLKEAIDDRSTGASASPNASSPPVTRSSAAPSIMWWSNTTSRAAPSCMPRAAGRWAPVTRST
jgi:predicted dehydrogenase